MGNVDDDDLPDSPLHTKRSHDYQPSIKRTLTISSTSVSNIHQGHPANHTSI